MGRHKMGLGWSSEIFNGKAEISFTNGMFVIKRDPLINRSKKITMYLVFRRYVERKDLLAKGHPANA